MLENVQITWKWVPLFFFNWSKQEQLLNSFKQYRVSVLFIVKTSWVSLFNVKYKNHPNNCHSLNCLIDLTELLFLQIDNLSQSIYSDPNIQNLLLIERSVLGQPWFSLATGCKPLAFKVAVIRLLLRNHYFILGIIFICTVIEKESGFWVQYKNSTCLRWLFHSFIQWTRLYTGSAGPQQNQCRALIQLIIIFLEESPEPVVGIREKALGQVESL